MRKVADQYEGIDLSGLKIVPLRENPVDIDGLLRLLRDVQPGQFDFITIDPIFKLLPVTPAAPIPKTRDACRNGAVPVQD